MKTSSAGKPSGCELHQGGQEPGAQRRPGGTVGRVQVGLRSVQASVSASKKRGFGKLFFFFLKGIECTECAAFLR